MTSFEPLPPLPPVLALRVAGDLALPELAQLPHPARLGVAPDLDAVETPPDPLLLARVRCADHRVAPTGLDGPGRALWTRSPSRMRAPSDGLCAVRRITGSVEESVWCTRV